MYVYVRSEPQLWTVGFYKPDGSFEPDSDHDVRDEARERVHYLNGGAEAVADPHCPECTHCNDPQEDD